MDGARNRRDFLRLAAGAATIAAGAACGSGSDKAKPVGAKAKGSATKDNTTLRIAQVSHFVPAFDGWFDGEYTERWGERNGVQVVVDHVTYADLPTRAAAEVAAGRGHDLFYSYDAAATFEDEVIDHAPIVEEVEAKVGKLNPAADRATWNSRTKKRFAFPDCLLAFPVLYRSDLWAPTGLVPDTWDDVLRAAPGLKAAGHPLGLSFSSDFDANTGLLGLMLAHGGSIQDEEGNVAINRPATVEAVKMGVALYRAGMTEEVLGWDSSGSANNRVLASGKASLIINTVSAQRAIEAQDADLARRIALLPAPAGSAGRKMVYGNGIYVIWKFARNQDAARRFLVDLAVDYRDAFVNSGFFNLPAFPGSVPDLGPLLERDAGADPKGKYALLSGAGEWSTNAGHPGNDSAAIQDVLYQFLIPKMFAAAARGEMSAEESVRIAESEIKLVYDKWRERGKI